MSRRHEDVAGLGLGGEGSELGPEEASVGLADADVLGAVGLEG